LRFPALVALSLLAAGCSATSPSLPPEAAAAGVAGADAVHTCRWPAQKLKPTGGYLDLKTCFGISGHIQYPKFSGNHGTISGKVAASVESSALGKVPIKVAKTVLYMTFTFTSTSKSDSIISFYGTKTGPGDGSKIGGPFDKNDTYYGYFEIKNSRGWGSITIGGTTKGKEVLGIPFPGTPIEAGVKTWLLMVNES
jgi:hypothetical protein